MYFFIYFAFKNKVKYNIALLIITILEIEKCGVSRAIIYSGRQRYTFGVYVYVK